MFKIYKKYKTLKKKHDTLLLENSKLLLDLTKYSEADRQLSSSLGGNIELIKLDMSTKAEVEKVSRHARSALSNPVIKYILNNGKYNLIMGIAKDARHYEEVVQKRSNLLFIDNAILGKLKEFANMNTDTNKAKEDDKDMYEKTLDFIN